MTFPRQLGGCSTATAATKEEGEVHCRALRCTWSCKSDLLSQIHIKMYQTCTWKCTWGYKYAVWLSSEPGPANLPLCGKTIWKCTWEFTCKCKYIAWLSGAPCAANLPLCIKHIKHLPKKSPENPPENTGVLPGSWVHLVLQICPSQSKLFGNVPKSAPDNAPESTSTGVYLVLQIWVMTIWKCTCKKHLLIQVHCLAIRCTSDANAENAPENEREGKLHQIKSVLVNESSEIF